MAITHEDFILAHGKPTKLKRYYHKNIDGLSLNEDELNNLKSGKLNLHPREWKDTAPYKSRGTGEVSHSYVHKDLPERYIDKEFFPILQNKYAKSLDVSKQDLVQYANQLISKSLDIMKAGKSKDPMLVKDASGNTPLHKLAKKNNLYVFQHQAVAKVKNMVGNTPLHFLAAAGNSDVLKHPLFNKVKNNDGQTPKDIYNNK